MLQQTQSCTVGTCDFKLLGKRGLCTCSYHLTLLPPTHPPIHTHTHTYTHTHTHTHTRTDPLESVSIMGLLWSHYCNSLVQSSTPAYLLSPFHSALETLPWSTFFPGLDAMDHMMKLSLTNQPSSFVFLGQIFPLFDWKTIGAAYRYMASQHGLHISPIYTHVCMGEHYLQLRYSKAVKRLSQLCNFCPSWNMRMYDKIQFG